MRAEPEIVRPKLTIVFALAKRRVREGLSVGIDQLVPLQFIIQLDRVYERPRVLKPEGFVRYGLNLIGSLQNPTLAPHIHNPVRVRRVREKSSRHLENDGVDVSSGLRIFTRVDEAIIAVRVFRKSVAIPGKRTGRQIFLESTTPVRKFGIVVEQIVTLQFQESFGNFQFANVRHRVRDVIKLRCIVYRPKKSWKVIKERIIPAANIGANGVASRRLQRNRLIGFDDRRETSASKVEESDTGPVVLIYFDPYFRWLECAQVFVFQSIEILQQTIQTFPSFGRSKNTLVW